MKRSGARSAAPTLALGVSLLIGGCSFVPEYRRPDPPVPGAWTTVDAGSARNVAPVHDGWWRDFGSAELNALVDRSLMGNFDLQAAIARVDEARGSAQIAGAALYPSLSVNGTAKGSSPAGSSLPLSVFAQASYEIDFWGKNRAAAHSAEALAQATAFDRETVTLTLTASVADTYFQILSLQDRVHLAQQIADSARRTLALLEAQASEGVASELQVQQQRNVVATFDAAVPALRQQLDQRVHLLAVLVGGIPEDFHVGGQSVDGLSIPEVQAGLPATLLTRRPDIQAAEARLVSANFDVGAARAALYPNIALTAQGGVASGALSHLFPPAALWDLAGSLVQPLFEGGRLRGRLKVDRAHAVELTATYRQTVVTAFQDVEDALTAVVRLKELEVADTVAVESARRASELADTRFQLGATDFLTVLTTERTLYQAEDALLQVRLQRLQAAVGLFRALGGGFDNAIARNQAGRT
ncbi:efflux transporter outer membrane subunit [Vitiosangium sp. GDMCC 1.1324]|uniref:efflux transporter outer membrane subunit n=1 Tax=Vitiosangium sp. (strain GDMCC 1.1324) TaxID=2138576 RepID=UPI000D3B4BE7|nr:efflux transporter outer membrane subunit [Vitiosangium sp. GDMCC 1.1324]PTL79162.1 multidrug transporter [Vitiosangium sp. GDMCC 1.1324]